MTGVTVIASPGTTTIDDSEVIPSPKSRSTTTDAVNAVSWVFRRLHLDVLVYRKYEGINTFYPPTL